MDRKQVEEVLEIRTERYNIITYSRILVDRITKQAVIFDPSWNFSVIKEKIDSLGIDIRAVFLTHSHIDHVNLAEKVARYTGAKVYMAQKEIECYGFHCYNLEKLEDGDIIKIGGLEITCILTPGHTAGSMCYLSKTAFFTGDTIFIEGCGLCFNDAAASEMYDSLQRVKRIVKPDIIVCPGHYYKRKGELSFEKVMRYNVYFQIDKKETFIKFRMRKGQKNLFKFI